MGVIDRNLVVVLQCPDYEEPECDPVHQHALLPSSLHADSLFDGRRACVQHIVPCELPPQPRDSEHPHDPLPRDGHGSSSDESAFISS